MIDSKYGLKYSFPHTLVHIVDNSAYAGELPVTETYDPSLFATIVVTGMPMGVDNRITTVSRSDVLNKAFGADTLTSSDIQKYGQAVEYPASLIRQNAPVRLLRVTPTDSKFAVAVLYIEWKISDDEKKVEVRLRVANESELAETAIDLSAFANTERLAKATFSRLAKPADNNNSWRREVLITYVSAGRGSAYNDFAVYINPPTYDQRKKYKNAVYQFGTIDTKRNSTLSLNYANELEAFTASLINDVTKLSTYGVTNTVDSVNTQMKKRLEGSSIMIPYVNEKAIRSLYADWHDFFEIRLNDTSENTKIEENRRAAYEYIYKTLDINMFDCIYGKTLYNDNPINIPYLQIDAIDSEIPLSDPDKVCAVAEQITDDGQTVVRPFTDKEQLSENPNNIVDAIYKNGLTEWIQELYDVENSDKAQKSGTSYVCKGFTSTSVTPGTVYIYNAETQPVFQIVTSISAYTGTLSTVTIPKVYHLNSNGKIDKTEGNSSMIKKYFYCSNQRDPSSEQMRDYANKRINATAYRKIVANDIIAVGYEKTTSDKTTTIKSFKLFQVKTVDDYNRISAWTEYPTNYYAALDYESHYSGKGIYDIIGLSSYTAIADGDTSPAIARAGNADESYNYNEIVFNATSENPENSDTRAFGKIGVLLIDNEAEEAVYERNDLPEQISGDNTSLFNEIDTNSEKIYNLARLVLNSNSSTEYQSNGFAKNRVKLTTMIGCFTENNFRVGTPPSAITIPSDMVGTFYDVAHVSDLATYNSYPSKNRAYNYLRDHTSDDNIIYRYQITGVALSAFKLAYTNIIIPNNYYLADYGINPTSEEGGIPVKGGYSGFFDDYSEGKISSIEFKLRYSELLVQAFRGEIDARILSPVRVPAKFMFDAGYNCVLGIKSLPYSEPSVEDIILASTIFTDDEKEEYAYDNSIVKTKIQFNSVDVKQAMYDLMIERCYQRIPVDKRPIGPGSGFQLYLDTGFSTNINTIKKIIETFRTKFTNPNAALDIGGYTSALNGVTYTYTKRVVDNLFRHCQQYTINKPFANTYATIPAAEVVEFFPNIDTTDWDLEELMYTSGGNSWVLDTQGNLRRKSQKTMYNEATGTSDLLQESNMRTLSQLIYLLQNQLDNWLLEYVDDGILTSMTESINNIFSGWVGTRVEALDIRFEKDINTDGGEIVVCYVNVVFRGLLLRVPIIVNVNRRES